MAARGICLPMNNTTQPTIGLTNRSKLASLALTTLLAWLAALAAHAGTHTWTGTGFFDNKDYLWSNPANWSPVGAPAPGEANVTLIFPNTSASRLTTNDIAGLNVASIQFLGTNYEIHAKPAGNPLKLGGGAAGTSWAVLAAADDCTFAKDCPLSLQTTGTVAVADNTFIEIYATLSGPGGFTKTGPGLMFLFGETANTYTGTTIVGDGLLGLSQGTRSPSQKGVAAVSGPLIVGGQPGFTIPTVRALNDNQFASTPVTMLGVSEILLWGTTNTFGSLTMQQGAKLTTGPLGAEGDWPGLLKLTGNVTTLSNYPGSDSAQIRGHVDLGTAQRTFNVQEEAELWMRAAIRGGSSSAGITKTGGGLLTLSGQNTYDGPTLIQGGQLSAHSGDTSLGSTVNGTTVSAGATLLLQTDILVNETLTLTGGPGAASLETLGWTNTFAGPITLNGICEVSVYDGGGNIGGCLILSGSITGPGALRKTGDGVLDLVGFGGNTFSGGLLAEVGVTRLNKSASAPAFSGPLSVGRTNNSFGDDGVAFVQQINQIPNSTHITILPRGVLDGSAADTIGNVDFYGGTLSGTGFTLTGNVTNYDTMPHSSGIRSEIAGTLNVSLGTHIFHGNTARSALDVTGTLQGTGDLTKTGPGILRLSNANSYSGLTWVKEGDLWMEGKGRPGSTALGTVIEAGASLYLDTCSVTNEALTLHGAPGTITFSSYGTNRWKSSITLDGQVKIWTGTILTLDGIIAGAGGVYFDPQASGASPATLEFAGNANNTYTGDTTIKSGKLILNKTAALAVPGNLFLDGNFKAYGTNVPAYVRLYQPNQISDSSAVTVTSPNWLDLNGNAEALGSLSGSGNVNLLAATLNAGGNGGSTTFSGLIYGTGGLTKTGAGAFTLSGDNSYTGPTVINAGTLLVNGQQPFSPLTIQNGAKLGGTGRVGNMAVNNGATIAPGASPGVLSCGNANILGGTATLQIEINGNAPGAYDQLAANGTVSMIGGTLQVLMNVGGAVSNQYVIVTNAGANAIAGTFTGLPEGASLTNQGAIFVITYHGGNGNDIVLIQQTVGYTSQITGAARQPNGRFAITASGFPNTIYRVDACTNLTPPVAWTQIGSVTANAAGTVSYSDVSAALYPVRFYRFRHE